MTDRPSDRRPTKHFAAFLARHKLDGEDVIDWQRAFRKGEYEGALVLTTRRLVHVRKGTFGDKSEPLPLDKISSVDVKAGVLLVDAVIHTSGDDIHVRFSSPKSEAEAFLRRLQAALHDRARSQPAIPSASDDVLSQIEKLATLHAAGALTDGEFLAKKSELLGRI